MITSDDQAAALLVAARASIERDDAHSLAFALRRAAMLGLINEGVALGTSIQHVTDIPLAIADRAVFLLRKEVVASNDPMVAYALARIYALGILGVECDNRLAFKYFARAADLGMDIASIYAGLYAIEAFEMIQGRRIAMDYFKVAAAAGYLVADRRLLMLRQDIGLPRKWIELLKLSVRAFRLALRDASDSRLFLLNPLALPNFESSQERVERG